MSGVNDLEPYAGNAEGLTAILTDIASTMPNPIVFKVVGYVVNAFEDVTQGDVLYSRTSDGQVGKAIANDTLDKAVVAGIAETTVTAGNEVRVIVTGQVAVSTSLDPGDLYFLSATSAGGLTKTPPTTAGHYVTLVGEAGTTNQIVLKIKRPIQLY
jgi:hypothetical protein|tara:strand:- start:44 stop:511 length:468 start_codon:yes stop_codon:yes gene_type:complete